MFSTSYSVEKAASAFVDEAACNWRHYAELTGLDGELANVGYAEEVGLKLLSIKGTNEEAMLKSVFEFHVENKNLRFKAQRVKVIERLLKPWTRKNDSLNETTRKFMQDWLLNRFGDPRLPVNRQGGWSDVSEETVEVVFRWLAGKSLDQFFAIIDKLALERQWKYRKAFWKAYYDKGHLKEAWVALGPDALDYARRIYGSELVAASLKNSTYKTDNTQSVLLLKLRNLTFSVWSHNGRCRAWREGDDTAPELYKSNYVHSDFKVRSLQIVPSHERDGIVQSSSETYWWQKQLSSFIFEETGIRINENDFWL